MAAWVKTVCFQMIQNRLCVKYTLYSKYKNEWLFKSFNYSNYVVDNEDPITGFKDQRIC